MRFARAVSLAGAVAWLSAAPAAQTPAAPQTPPSSAPQTPPPPRAPTTSGLPTAPMPIQKQALEYFAGVWTFTWTGPETPLGPGPRRGMLTFTPREGGRILDGVTDAKSEDGPFRETLTVQFDPDTKTLAWSERRPNGVEWKATGDWSSPLAIRFEVAPVTVKGQPYRLKRRLAVISAGSFSVTEEYASGDGPFRRLGNGLFTRQVAQ